jgi:UDP:flavonoid glycosyltransferase YjiC (YdhE family)
MAQAMAAGIPQVIMPMAHDQYDNAFRAEKLGVAKTIQRRAFGSDSVAHELRQLLGSNTVAERCRDLAGRLRHSRARDAAASEIVGAAYSTKRTNAKN